jgi:hypothetical protein
VRDALYAADRLTDQVERDKAITDVLKRCADGWDAVGDDGQPVPFDDAGLAQLLPEGEVHHRRPVARGRGVGGRVKKRLSLAVAVALRYGALKCGGGDGQCDECPSAAEPVHINAVACEACGGDGCDQCAGRGVAMLTTCPRACLTAEGGR